MDERIDEQASHEKIILSDLKDINKKLLDEYLYQKPNKNYFSWRYSDEEKPRTEEEKKKILEKKINLKKKVWSYIIK